MRRIKCLSPPPKGIESLFPKPLSPVFRGRGVGVRGRIPQNYFKKRRSTFAVIFEMLSSTGSELG
jgi:hypothetical protein